MSTAQARADPKNSNQTKKERHNSDHIQLMVRGDVADARSFVQGVNKVLLDRMESFGYPPFMRVDQVGQIPNRLQKGKEFAVCPLFDPAIIDEVCQNGFFPMTIGFGGTLRMFAAKCHVERAVTIFNPPANTIELHETDPSKVRGVFRAQGGGTKKKARNHRILINQDWTFEPICRMIYEQHGEDWMCGPLRQCFYNMFKEPGKYQTKIHAFAIVKEKANTETGEKDLKDSDLYEIVSGELGYSVGTLYTSLTGAYTEPGAGSVQLSVMGLLLEQLGYKLWDLGMQMKYKQEQLHSVDWSRSRWLRTVQAEKLNSVGAFALENFPKMDADRCASTQGGHPQSLTNLLCSCLYYKAEDSVMDPDSASARKKEAKKQYKLKKNEESAREEDAMPEQQEVVSKQENSAKNSVVQPKPSIPIFSPFLRILFA